MVDVVYWIWLQQLFGIGTARSEQMMTEFSSPKELYQRLLSEDLPDDFLGSREKEELEQTMEQAKQIEELTLKKRCSIITPNHPEYPPLLQHIYAKPAVLYVKGSLECLQKEFPIAIVGTRHCSDYGEEIATSFAGALVKQGVCIISGFAHGIDAIAQGAALQAGGRTVGLLACGLDVDYPKDSSALKRAASENGAVVTEYPMGAKAIPARFPPRNRVIAGMSRGVIIIEAGATSGALITANHALESGREVFAVPGSVFSGKHTGSHQLIRQGVAKLVSTPEDILVEFPEYSNIATKQEEKHKKAEKTEPIHKVLPIGLGDSAEILYKAVGVELQTADQLANKTKLGISEVLSDLTVLEILGLIRSHPGGLFGLQA